MRQDQKIHSLQSDREVRVLRTTRSVCPTCRRPLPARMVVKEGKVFFEKICPEHGDCTVFLSANPEYLGDLIDAYYALVPENLPVKILEIALTPRCGLKCPICSSTSLRGKVSDLTVEEVMEIVRGNFSKEIILWGLEASEHPDLEAMIKAIRKLGKNPYLSTNGVKLSDYAYVERLHLAGLSSVHLQFDGFEEKIYHTLRGQNLLDTKLRALDNLRQLGITTCLNVTLAKGVNEHQIESLISYCAQNDFIKQIGFLPLIKIGSAESCGEAMVPHLHEFLSIIERETKGKIKVDSLRIFQKFMYVVYRFTKFRRCFWFTLYILIKDRKRADYIALDEVVDFKRLDSVVTEYINGCKKKPGVFNDLRLMAGLIPLFLHRKVLPLIFGFLAFIVCGNQIRNLRLGKDVLWMTCVDFCDVYKMDLDMADRYCEEILAMKKGSDVIYAKTYVEVIESLALPSAKCSS